MSPFPEGVNSQAGVVVALFTGYFCSQPVWAFKHFVLVGQFNLGHHQAFVDTPKEINFKRMCSDRYQESLFINEVTRTEGQQFVGFTGIDALFPLVASGARCVTLAFDGKPGLFIFQPYAHRTG